MTDRATRSRRIAVRRPGAGGGVARSGRARTSSATATTAASTGTPHSASATTALPVASVNGWARPAPRLADRAIEPVTAPTTAALRVPYSARATAGTSTFTMAIPPVRTTVPTNSPTVPARRSAIPTTITSGSGQHRAVQAEAAGQRRRERRDQPEADQRQRGDHGERRRRQGQLAAQLVDHRPDGGERGRAGTARR